MSEKPTEQEAFWTGEFGAEYTDRNVGPKIIASNLALFSRALMRASPICSVLELGANRGLNLLALRALLPLVTMTAVEINARACAELRKLGTLDVRETSVYDFSAEHPFDLVLIKGVLIHLNPERLKDAYDVIHTSCRRYVLLAEYYNPSPVAIPYRGHADRLFKRDFAGELLDRFADLRLVDYGFVYHRDPTFPQDDLTWFLLERAGKPA